MTAKTVLEEHEDLARLDRRRFAPPPGTILVREWGRKSHRVMVMADGYAWNGKPFDSLSQVAFAITGTKWNDPRHTESNAPVFRIPHCKLMNAGLKLRSGAN